jgi:hypothetical protein
LDEFKVHVDTDGNSTLGDDCVNSLTSHMGRLQEEEAAKDAAKIDWRTPCEDDIAECNNITVRSPCNTLVPPLLSASRLALGFSRLPIINTIIM